MCMRTIISVMIDEVRVLMVITRYYGLCVMGY